MPTKFNQIVEELQGDFFFNEFKFRKKNNMFIKKDNNGFEAIEIQHWDGYDLDRDSRALVIKPLYMKRFNVLHTWQDKFSFKSKTDQNNNYSIIFDGESFNKQEDYFFPADDSDFRQTLGVMKKDITNNASAFFDMFSSLKNLYNYLILPILDSKASLPDSGADWIFEYLILSKVVDPPRYSKLKSAILNQVEILNKRGEPNVTEYYPKLNDILLEIEG